MPIYNIKSIGGITLLLVLLELLDVLEFQVGSLLTLTNVGSIFLCVIGNMAILFVEKEHIHRSEYIFSLEEEGKNIL